MKNKAYTQETSIILMATYFHKLGQESKFYKNWNSIGIEIIWHAEETQRYY